jgi:hypothetical protein
MKKTTFLLAFIFTLLAANFASAKNDDSQDYQTVDESIIIDRITNNDIEVQLPSLIFTFKDAEIAIKFKNPQHTRLLVNEGKIKFIINGEDRELEFHDGLATFNHSFANDKKLSIYTEEFGFSSKVTAYPLWVILAPLLLLLGWIVLRKINNSKK